VEGDKEERKEKMETGKERENWGKTFNEDNEREV
jgi:hypothetical protein